MTRPAVSWAVAAVAALLALILLLPGLGSAPFDDPGEGQQAEIAREAWASGDLFDLRLNGVRYFDKPPLLYWLIALDFRAWGPSEWAARLPSVAGAAAAAAATAFLGARLLGPGAGLLAGAALLSCALFAVYGRYVRPETLFVASIQIALTGLLLGATAEGRRARRWAVAGCAALGLASLAKDPLGLIAPLAAVAATLAVCGRWRPVRRWLPLTGVLLMLLVGLGWYAWSALQHPGFLWYVAVDNHILNAVGLRRFPDEDVPLATGEFLTVAALGAFPWIIPAGLTVVSLYRRRAWRDPEEIPWIALAVWMIGLWGFFALLVFKLPQYGLPAYPAVALLAARWWTERGGRSRAAAFLHAGLFALVAVGLAFVAAGDGKVFLDTVFSAADVYTRKEAAVAQASPLPPWSLLQPIVARTALIMAAGAVALTVSAWRRAGRWTWTIVAATMLAVMPAATGTLGLVAGARAVRSMAVEVRRLAAPGVLLVHEGPIENSGALEFYSDLRPVLVDARRSVLGIGATFPDAAGTFWTADELAAAWLSGRPILLVTSREPGQSVVSSLPPGRVGLLRAENGRWLYGSVPAAAPAPR